MRLEASGHQPQASSERERRGRDVQDRPAPPRREHLEQGEPVHRAGPTSISPTTGREEAKKAGQLLKDEGYTFDVAYTSVLKRAIRTLWIVLDEMDLMWIPVHRNWRLNERHYGALQGLNKAETAAKYGDEQVKIWRRSYDIPPPALDAGRPAAPRPRPALRDARCRQELPLDRVPEGHRRPLPAVLARDDRADGRSGAARADRRARQQPARAGEVPRQHLGRATSSS